MNNKETVEPAAGGIVLNSQDQQARHRSRHAKMSPMPQSRATCTTLVHGCYPENMATRSKPARSVRQSVTIPATLAADVRRVAKERRVTMSRALVDLAERGVRAEAEAKQQLKAAYRNFVQEAEPQRKNEAGRDLIRAIFGKDSVAEDPIL
jgi:hypothetical protein